MVGRALSAVLLRNRKSRRAVPALRSGSRRGASRQGVGKTDARDAFASCMRLQLQRPAEAVADLPRDRQLESVPIGTGRARIGNGIGIANASAFRRGEVAHAYHEIGRAHV